MSVVTEKNDLLRKMIANLKDIEYSVKVGIQGVNASEKHKTAYPSGVLTMVELGSIHEFGAPSAGIPQRAFIRGLVDAEPEKWAKELENQFKKVIIRAEQSGIIGTAKAGLFIMGEKYRTAIIKRVKAGIPPPLKSPRRNFEFVATAKQARANERFQKSTGGLEVPLADTGALLRSISSVVVAPGESK